MHCNACFTARIRERGSLVDLRVALLSVCESGAGLLLGGEPGSSGSEEIHSRCLRSNVRIELIGECRVDSLRWAYCYEWAPTPRQHLSEGASSWPSPSDHAHLPPQPLATHPSQTSSPSHTWTAHLLSTSAPSCSLEVLSTHTTATQHPLVPILRLLHSTTS